MRTVEYKVGDELVCPICRKKFKASENTAFIAKGGFVCSWECFKKNLKTERKEMESSTTRL